MPDCIACISTCTELVFNPIVRLIQELIKVKWTGLGTDLVSYRIKIMVHIKSYDSFMI